MTGAHVGQVEEGTPFARWFRPGAAPLPSERAAADQLRRASAVLRGAGYEHYEVSSFALPGKRRGGPLRRVAAATCACAAATVVVHSAPSRNTHGRAEPAQAPALCHATASRRARIGKAKYRVANQWGGGDAPGPPRRCAHNQVYWAANAPYHAFGLGAASLLGARRFARPRAMGAYRAWLEGFEAAGGGLPGARRGASPHAVSRAVSAVADMQRCSLRLLTCSACHACGSCGDALPSSLEPVLE